MATCKQMVQVGTLYFVYCFLSCVCDKEILNFVRYFSDYSSPRKSQDIDIVIGRRNKMGSEIKNKRSVSNEKIDLNQFIVGGKCLAFHGPLLYEAKILRIWNPIESKLILDNNNNNNNNSGNSSSSNNSGGSNNSSNRRHDQSDLYPPEDVRDQYNFFIHYQGWKATWDEWIGVDRIREYNEENVELKKQLIQEAKDSQKSKNQHDHNSSSSNKKRKNNGSDSNLNNKNTESNNSSSSGSKRRNVESGSGTSTASSSSSSTSKKYSSSSHHGFNKKHGNSSTNQDNNNSRGNQTNVNSNSNSVFSSSNTSSSTTSSRDDSNHWNYGPSKLVLHIPIKLKAKLVDDWELITKDKRILTLPSKMTINQMLSTYKKQAMKNMTLVEQCQLNEFLSGLIEYFECSLSRLLLYRLERLQYETLLKGYKERNENMIKSDIYGPLHLLRLITILPELISATTMDLQSCQLIIKQCEKLMIWMTIHIDSVFPTLNPREDSNGLLNNEQGYDNTSSQYEGVALGL